MMEHVLTRDRFTWLMYVMLGFYSFFLNGLGVVLPYIRTEQRFSLTISSLHFSAFGVGLLLAGYGTDRLTCRLPYRKVFWVGTAGMIGGGLLLCSGQPPMVTIAGAMLMGALGSVLPVLIISLLSEKTAAARSIAITEANVMAGICALIAPFMVGLFVHLVGGWRSAFVAMFCAGMAACSALGRTAFPVVSDEAQATTGALPRGFWAYWLLLVLAAAVEFCIIFLCATFLVVERRLPTAWSALGTGVFLGAMTLGRVLGSRVARSRSGVTIVAVSLILCLAGLLVHWRTPGLILSVVGLFVSGVGVSNLYPQLVALAVGAAPGQTDKASARTLTASGIAILCLPFAAGRLADSMGVGQAYAIVTLLVVLLSVGLLMVHRLKLGVR